MIFPNAGVQVEPSLLILLGLMTGVLGGFFGVGGGFLITGGLLVLGVPPVYAVGTGLTLVMGSSLLNALKYGGAGNVDFKLALLMAIGAAPALYLAQRLNVSLEAWGVEGPVIRYIYTVFMASVGAFIIYDYYKMRRVGLLGEVTTTRQLSEKVRSLRIPPHSIRLPLNKSISFYVSLPASGISGISVWIPLAAGFTVSFFAGLLGAGGGFIIIPFLVFVLGIPARVTAGTSLLQIMITSAVGSFIYALSDRVDLLMTVIMLAAASIGSVLGVATAHHVDGARIRFLFGVTILMTSLSVALRQLSDSPGPGALSYAAAAVLLGFSGLMCLIIALEFIGGMFASESHHGSSHREMHHPAQDDVEKES